MKTQVAVNSVFQLDFSKKIPLEHSVISHNHDIRDPALYEVWFMPMRRPECKVILHLLDFGREISSKEAIREIVHLGYHRPWYEDVLYFGPSFPEKQRERPIVFLHEPFRDRLFTPGRTMAPPWDDACGYRYIIVLDTNGSGKRRIFLNRFKYAWFRCMKNQWPKECLFAFVKEVVPLQAR